MCTGGMKMFNLPMDHIGLHCSDVELNAKWYQENLGFTVAGKFPGKVQLRNVKR